MQSVTIWYRFLTWSLHFKHIFVIPLPQTAKGCDRLRTIHKKTFYYNTHPSDKCDQLNRFLHWAKKDTGKPQSYRYLWKMYFGCCRVPGLATSFQGQPSSHTAPVCQNRSPLTQPRNVPWKGSSTSCSLPKQGVVALHPSPSEATTYPIFYNNNSKTRENSHSPFLLRAFWAAVKSLTLLAFHVCSFYNSFRAGSGQPTTTSSLQAASAALSHSWVITAPRQAFKGCSCGSPFSGFSCPRSARDVPLPLTLTQWLANQRYTQGGLHVLSWGPCSI